MQYILTGVKKPHHFFLHNICLKGMIPLLKNYMFFVLLFDSYGRAYCIHAVMSLLQMILIYIHFYFRFLKIKYCCIFFNQLIHNCAKVDRKPYTFRFQQIL